MLRTCLAGVTFGYRKHLIDFTAAERLNRTLRRCSRRGLGFESDFAGSCIELRRRSSMEAAAPGTSTDASLLQRLREARARTDELFAIVRPEAFTIGPFPSGIGSSFTSAISKRSIGTSWRPACLTCRRLLPLSNNCFAFGIDPVDGGLPSDQPQDWPAREEIAAYNRRVRETLDERLRGLG